MKKYSQVILIFSIFIFAFVLRTYNLPAFIAYHQDQVRDLLFIKNNLDSGTTILLGPKASVGNFFLPPFWYYLMAVSYIVSHSPIAPAFLVALFSSLAVILIYLLGKKFLSAEIGTTAALIYAVSPLSIEHSRFAWNPNPIPFFVILTLFFLYYFTFRDKEWGFYLGAVSANLALQLHYQGSIIVLFFFLCLIIYKKLSLKRLLIYLGINILLATPFLYYEFTNHFRNTLGILAFVGKGQTLKLFGIPFYIKFVLNEFSYFLAATLILKNKIIGFILLGLFISSFFTVKFKKEQQPIKFFMIFSLCMLFVYKNSLIPFYLLFLIIPTILYTTICLYSAIPKQVGNYLILAIVIVALIGSPIHAQTDNTYLGVQSAVNTIAHSNNYCITYDVFDETFIKQKFTYLFAINSHPPTPNNCQKEYLICEPATCKIALTNFRSHSQTSIPTNHTGVYIYEVKR